MHPTVIPASPLLGWTMSSTPLCFTFLSTAGATGLLLLLKRTPVQAPSLRQQQSTRYNVCNLYKAAGLIFLTARKIFQKWAQYTEYSISDIWSIKKIRYKLYQYSQYTETTVEVWKSIFLTQKGSQYFAKRGHKQEVTIGFGGKQGKAENLHS